MLRTVYDIKLRRFNTGEHVMFAKYRTPQGSGGTMKFNVKNTGVHKKCLLLDLCATLWDCAEEAGFDIRKINIRLETQWPR